MPMFYFSVLCVLSSFAIIWQETRGLVVLIYYVLAIFDCYTVTGLLFAVM